MEVKPQDLVFVVVLAGLIFMRNPKLSVVAGTLSILVSIPLFAFWIFFTAERLTWYAATFLLLAALQNLVIIKRRKNENRN